LVKRKSKAPIKMPTAREIPTTKLVSLIASFFEGQITLPSSLLTSFKKTTGLVAITAEILPQDRGDIKDGCVRMVWIIDNGN